MTDYIFQEDWERRQAERLPETTKPKERLPIGINEIPPLVSGEIISPLKNGAESAPVKTKRKGEIISPLQTKENAPAIPSVNHRGNTKTSHNTKGLF